MSESNYSKSHLKFIMSLRKQGKTYAEISIQFGKKFGLKKSPAAIENTFRRYKHEYDLEGLKTSVELKAEIVAERLLNDFVSIIEKRKYVPTSQEFIRLTPHSADQIKSKYGSFEELEKIARNKYPKVFKTVIDEKSFNEDSFKNLRKYISDNNVFVITAAVTGCDVHDEGLSAINNFCKRNKAALLIQPCADPAHMKEHKSKWSLSHKLPKEKVVFRDVSLNENVFISSIKLSAKHINPLTGLSRIGQRQGSFIYASPKQFLEYVATSNNKDIPRAMMTTGAITKPNYTTELYMSERTAYIADQDHVLGGIIVEIKNNKVFFFRQFQIEPKTGAFIDVDTKYLPDGSVEKVRADLVQLPDYHVGSTDPSALKVFKEVVDCVKPKIMTLEDFFDGISINHHEKSKVTTQAVKASKGINSLERELKLNQKAIDELCKWPVDKLVFKYGNHEDFLKRWLEAGSYMFEPHNHYMGLCLAKALFEGEMPFEFAMRSLFPIEKQDKVTFLGINDSFRVNGIENAVHGHLGAGGKHNPNMESLEKSYGKVNVGHNHSASILRDVFRVGTLTHLQLSYNDGPSAWTQTMLIQHQNGTRQLINAIYGEWRLKD